MLQLFNIINIKQFKFNENFQTKDFNSKFNSIEITNLQ